MSTSSKGARGSLGLRPSPSLLARIDALVSRSERAGGGVGATRGRVALRALEEGLAALEARAGIKGEASGAEAA